MVPFYDDFLRCTIIHFAGVSRPSSACCCLTDASRDRGFQPPAENRSTFTSAPCPVPCTLPSRQRLSEAKLSADAALLDPALLQRCLLFYAHTCQLQLRQMGAQSGQLPARVPDAFRAQLEWYIEDIAEFLLFTLQ